MTQRPLAEPGRRDAKFPAVGTGEASLPGSASGLARERRCVKCGRLIGLYRTPDGLFTFAHRVTVPHVPGTPWCSGGGRKVRRG